MHHGIPAIYLKTHTYKFHNVVQKQYSDDIQKHILYCGKFS